MFKVRILVGKSMTMFDFSKPPLQTPLLWLAPLSCRDHIASLLEENRLCEIYDNPPSSQYPSILTVQPLDYKYLFEYTLYQIQGIYLAQREIIAGKEIGMQTRKRQCEVFVSVIHNDLKRVSTLTALAAWLTTDHWRWHEKVEHLPEDLAYGLVLQYPNAVLRFTQFMLYKQHRRELLKLLKPIAVERSYREAKRNLEAILHSINDERSIKDLEIYDER